MQSRGGARRQRRAGAATRRPRRAGIGGEERIGAALIARTQGETTTSVQGAATASIGAGCGDGDGKAGPATRNSRWFCFLFGFVSGSAFFFCRARFSVRPLSPVQLCSVFVLFEFGRACLFHFPHSGRSVSISSRAISSGIAQQAILSVHGDSRRSILISVPFFCSSLPLSSALCPCAFCLRLGSRSRFKWKMVPVADSCCRTGLCSRDWILLPHLRLLWHFLMQFCLQCLQRNSFSFCSCKR
nr:uncharacterized protein LOC120974922 [Aegilops tauschii subsp. strangulata]